MVTIRVPELDGDCPATMAQQTVILIGLFHAIIVFYVYIYIYNQLVIWVMFFHLWVLEC